MKAMLKHGVDRHVIFGDGGSLDLEYPIFTDDIDFDHSGMQKRFTKIAENTNDWRPNEPIQNLIDPELFVLKILKKPERVKTIENNLSQNVQALQEKLEYLNHSHISL